MAELPKNYDPKNVETKIYQKWLDEKCFEPKNDPQAKSFSVVIPPPNVTGSLHMGHTLNNTIQDILVRYHRMLGENTLWVPGTDHAGIATQHVVEKKLKKEGISRHQLGREKFIEEVWKWKDESGGRILTQLKTLGFSCDWSRLKFTLDDGYTKAVRKAFVHYFNKGYIYKGPRVVNWCPRCGTAISDIEIKYRDQKAKLYTFKYSKDFPFTIATTRPETKIADTAVAVNPKDPRYAKYIGQTLETDFIGFPLKLKIIGDRHVEMEFGTGALGVTPAHSMVDFEMAKQNNLEVKNIIGQDGKMTAEANQYAGLKVETAREQIVEAIEKAGLMEKVEDYDNSISLCDRCDTPIEPLISNQWFVKMDELAKPAIEVVENETIKIYPTRYKKTYLDWMTNLRDWCVSRQLWWGHQLPVWYCEACDKEHQHPIISETTPTSCPKCDSQNLVQDEDVLDTWFSSALWPFAALGWPEKSTDLEKFYPTTLLSTAPDILYLWVARMIFSGIEFIGKVPFNTVYLHSTILTKDGSRMSKSRPETTVDPMNMVEKYGADATRFGIIYQTSRDLQAIKFSEDDLLAGKKFINKLWNMARFIIMLEDENKDAGDLNPQTLADRWILHRLNSTITEVTDCIKDYEFGKAEHALYDFAWKDFADWYIEIAKNEKNIKLVKFVYFELLKLLHPFVPFLTEEIYSSFHPDEMIISAKWPEANSTNLDEKTLTEFTALQNLVTQIRNAKKDAGIDPYQSAEIKLEVPEPKIIENQKI
ncbi:MAG: valine--tRNA ligase, partial [Patescibacteria group bacterium]